MTAPLLVVDDDPTLRNLVAWILQSADYPVVTAADGREALDVIAHEPPTAIFLDMQMPVLDGSEVVHALHEQGRHIPTVVMTARADAARCCRELGADAYLAKPFQVEDVLSTAAHLSGRPDQP